MDLALIGCIFLAFLLLGAGGVYWPMSLRVKNLERQLEAARKGAEGAGKMVALEREMADWTGRPDEFSLLLGHPGDPRGGQAGEDDDLDHATSDVAEAQGHDRPTGEGSENDPSES